MRIIIFTKYNKMGPSSYYRVYQFLEKSNQKYSIDIQYFWGDYYFKYIVNKIGFQKYVFILPGLFIGVLRRLFFLFFKLYRYDAVRIEKDFLPGFPVLFEYFIKFVLKKKIIFEFDDAVFLTNFPRNKTPKLISLSNVVIAGNNLLKQYAQKYNSNITVIPTGVDYEQYMNIKSVRVEWSSNIVIGWIGSSSGLKYIKEIEPALFNLEKKGYKFEFRIICNEDIELKLKNKKFIKWNRDSADIDMSYFDIGIMPLSNDEFSKYKCGFKIIQYIAMKIAVVASPYGINQEIINNGESGFLAETTLEWEESLERLLIDSELRRKLSEDAYSDTIGKFDLSRIQLKYDEVYSRLQKS